MKLQDLLTRLHRLATKSLPLWDVPSDATARLINVSENATYLIENTSGYRSILRIHREGYHTRRAIDSELEWLGALADSGIINTANVHIGRDGNAIQMGQVYDLEPRFMVMFQFLDGIAPNETGDMTQGFEDLGAIAARCHEHVLNWEKPNNFQRLTWDTDAVFGANPTWGNWRDAPGVTAVIKPILEDVENTICNRLKRYGKNRNCYNLIHADMRLANLLMDGSKIQLIDFDDCGFGWFMYDFAAAISFIEDDPRIPDLKGAWLKGYRTVRTLTPQDETEIDTFIMLRRMALLAWIGSHIEAPEPQALAPDFAANTAKLGQTYLNQYAN